MAYVPPLRSHNATGRLESLPLEASDPRTKQAQAVLASFFGFMKFDAGFEEQLQSSDYLFGYIAEEQVVSAALARRLPSTAGEELYIDWIARLNGHQFRDMGGALLDAMVLFARDKKMSSVAAHVWSKSVGGRKLLTSRQFSLVGDCNNHYRKDLSQAEWPRPYEVTDKPRSKYPFSNYVNKTKKPGSAWLS